MAVVEKLYCEYGTNAGEEFLASVSLEQASGSFDAYSDFGLQELVV